LKASIVEDKVPRGCHTSGIGDRARASGAGIVEGDYPAWGEQATPALPGAADPFVAVIAIDEAEVGKLPGKRRKAFKLLQRP
jgi:hypothetical protein